MAFYMKKQALVLVILICHFRVFSTEPVLPLHIFLSFRGTDTRENFASLLHDAFVRAGFNVFMDDESIRTGQDIDFTIEEAINNSMGAVIIFSKDFAASSWCLDELVLILERKRRLGSGYVLQPVYVNGVRPDDVQELSGSYGEALAKHKKWYSFWKYSKVKMWSAALKEVGGYKGRVLSGKWAKFINEIVEEIKREFTALGVEVNPPPQADHATRIDDACGLHNTPMLTTNELMAILSDFMYRCRGLLDIIMASSFIQQQCNLLVQVQPPEKPTNNNEADMELKIGSEESWDIYGALCMIIVFLCSILMLFGRDLYDIDRIEVIIL